MIIFEYDRNMKMILRHEYLNKLKRFIEAPTVVAVTGLRRVGKSVLLRQFANEVRQQGEVVYIDKENLDFDNIREAQDLVRFVKSQYSGTGRCFVIIDEVQLINSWERAIASISAWENTRVLISGSNATLFSGELATRLAGRYTTLRLMPLSWKEFNELYSKTQGTLPEEMSLFTDYRRIGGLPGLLHTDLSGDLITQMQRDIYNTIALRDIIERHKIRDIESFEAVSRFAMDNIGSLINAKNISDYMKTHRKKGSPDTVLNYLSFLCGAFVLDKIDRYDVRGKRLLQINSKYFLGDLGLRTGLMGFGDHWIAGDLENLVFHELVRRGYRVSIGVVDRSEIDFIAEGNNTKIYIQVAYLIERQETRDREMAPLLAVKDAHPKFLLSMDPLSPGGLQGIQHIRITEFLNGATI